MLPLDLDSQHIVPNISICHGKLGYSCPISINESTSPIDHRDTAAVAVQATYVALIILFSGVGNLLVLLAIYTNKELQNKTSIFVANLAIADLANGVIAVPFILVCTIKNSWPYTQTLCSFLGFLIILLCTVSMGTLGFIAHDRYCAIVHPLMYHDRMSKPKIYFFLFFIWFPSLIMSVCPLLGWSEYIYIDNEYLCTANWGLESSYTITLSIVCFGGPLIIMVYSYAKIFIVARKHSHQIAAIHAFLSEDNHGHCTSSTSRPSIFRASTKRKFKKDAKSALMLLVVIVTFLVCWVPHGVTMYSFFIGGHNTPDAVYTTTTLLAMSNSMLNPFLYGLLHRPYRRAFKRLLFSRLMNKKEGDHTNSEGNRRQIHKRGNGSAMEDISSPGKATADETNQSGVFLVTSHSFVYNEDSSVSVAPVDIRSVPGSQIKEFCISEMLTHTIRITQTTSISNLTNSTDICTKLCTGNLNVKLD